MDKRILYGGAAALAAYFWWASRSTGTPSAAVTSTPSTTPNGVGFDIASALKSVFSQKPAVADPTATSPVTNTTPTTGPAPANTATFAIGGGTSNPAPTGSGYFSAAGIEINDPTAVGRFDSINAYINSLDWSADNKAASSAALAQAANQYGVSQSEISIASGYSMADVGNLMAGQTVARY